MEQLKNWIVVDDEELSLKNTKNMLGEENMRVSCMRSGRDLLKFIEKNDKTPDLILLDIMMPEMNGFDTFNALRELEDNEGKPHIPVIFLTGENDSATEQQGLEIGASDFIRKTFNKEIIVKRIENIINNSKTIENLTEEAMVDMLTGFLNKARGTERISKLCTRKTGALMIMDLDNFKLVNDLFGHDMGDKILVAFSDIIRNNTKDIRRVMAATLVLQNHEADMVSANIGAATVISQVIAEEVILMVIMLIIIASSTSHYTSN